MAPALESHLAKYRKLVPALALINHLADGGAGPIGEKALMPRARVRRIPRNSRSPRLRVRNRGEAATAKLICRRIRKGDLADGFAARDIRRKEWSGLTDNEAIKAGLELLADLDWIDAEDDRNGGPAAHGLCDQSEGAPMSRLSGAPQDACSPKMRAPDKLTKLTKALLSVLSVTKVAIFAGDEKRAATKSRSGPRWRPIAFPPVYLDAWARLQRQRPLSVAGAALLRTGRDSWSGEDWRAFFDERAGIAEFDGGLPRLEAEARAFGVLRRRMAQPAIPCARRPAAASAAATATSAPRSTVASRRGKLPAMLGCILAAGPHGTPRRQAEAVAALAAMGIATRREFPNDFEKNGGA